LPQMEANGQDFTTILTLEFLGVILIAADGIPNWERFRGVLRVYVWSACFMALVGFLQATLKINVAEYIRLPGLQIKGEIADFQMRGDGGSFRVAGTATHYIEFATVMAMAVPYAIHFAKYAPSKRARAAAGLGAALMAAAIPLAISRTGVLALGVVLVVMLMFGWNWRMRYNVMFCGAVVV